MVNVNEANGQVSQAAAKTHEVRQRRRRCKSCAGAGTSLRQGDSKAAVRPASAPCAVLW
jgi:hypothetical protein